MCILNECCNLKSVFYLLLDRVLRVPHEIYFMTVNIIYLPLLQQNGSYVTLGNLYVNINDRNKVKVCRFITDKMALAEIEIILCST